MSIGKKFGVADAALMATASLEESDGWEIIHLMSEAAQEAASDDCTDSRKALLQMQKILQQAREDAIQQGIDRKSVKFLVLTYLALMEPEDTLTLMKAMTDILTTVRDKEGNKSARI
jgi:predicted RNA binding protein with dsRBD fold (UPF0201 family)